MSVGTQLNLTNPIPEVSIKDQLQAFIDGDLDLTERPVNQSEVKRLLRKHKLDWTVSKIQQKIHVPQPKIKGLEQPDLILPSRFFSIIRDTDNHEYTSVEDKYQPIQNHEAMEVAFKFSDILERPISDVKVYDKGGVIAIDILESETDVSHLLKRGVNKGDTIKTYLRVITSHNKKKGFGVALHSVVLTCGNGMTRTDKEGFISVRHMGSVNKKVQAALKGFGKLKKESDKMFTMYDRLAATPVQDEHIAKALAIMTGQSVKTVEKEIHTRTSNIMAEVEQAFLTEMSYKKGLYGLLQGATKFTTHKALAKRLKKQQQNVLSADAPAVSKMFGEDSRRELKLYKYLSTQVKKN